MEDKVSIIIPVYNVEKYLAECIESVLQQTYTNWEMLLIDDGSTDHSSEICEEYAKKDVRIKVIHQENGGQSKARNTGLDAATGEYIMFLDSDDIYDEKAVEVLQKEISEKNADYIVANYMNMENDGTKWDHPIFNQERYQNFELSIEDYKDSFFVMNNTIWNKIYRKSFLDSIQLRFEEGIPSEDLVFITYCFIKAKKVFYIKDIVTYYRQRNNNNSVSNNCSYDFFVGSNKAYHMVYENFKKNNQLGFYRYNYAKSMTYLLYKFIDSDLIDREQRIKLLKEMKWLFALSYELKVPACQESLHYIIDAVLSQNYEQAVKYCAIVKDIRDYVPKNIRMEMSKPTQEFYVSIAKYDEEYK